MGGLIECLNVPRSIHAVVGAKMATLVECDTVLGLEDVYNLMEIMAVDAHNRQVMQKHADKD